MLSTLVLQEIIKKQQGLSFEVFADTVDASKGHFGFFLIRHGMGGTLHLYFEGPQFIDQPQQYLAEFLQGIDIGVIQRSSLDARCGSSMVLEHDAVPELGLHHYELSLRGKEGEILTPAHIQLAREIYGLDLRIPGKNPCESFPITSRSPAEGLLVHGKSRGHSDCQQRALAAMRNILQYAGEELTDAVRAVKHYAPGLFTDHGDTFQGTILQQRPELRQDSFVAALEHLPSADIIIQMHADSYVLMSTGNISLYHGSPHIALEVASEQVGELLPYLEHAWNIFHKMTGTPLQYARDAFAGRRLIPGEPQHTLH